MESEVVDFVPFEKAVPVSAQNQFGEARKLWQYFGKNPGPDAFLLLVPENNIVKPHFHRINQFQVFFPAPGALYQGKPLGDEIVVHYADAYTPYGPITTSDSKLEFFTLRAINDPKGMPISYMPKDRAKLIRRGKRSIHESIPGRVEGAALSKEPATETVFEDANDELLVQLTRVAAGGQISILHPSTGGGQYHLVLKGSAQCDGKLYGARALLWRDPNAAPVQIEAGEAGLELLTMRFPFGSQQIDEGQAVLT